MLKKGEIINERAWYDAMQNIFLIVTCKLIAIYMIIAADNACATVDKIDNHSIYYNNSTKMDNISVSTLLCRKIQKSIAINI